MRGRMQRRRLLAMGVLLTLSGAVSAAPRGALARTAKPSGPVAMHYELIGEPTLGRRLTVVVTIEPALRLDAAEVTVHGDAGLVMNPGLERTAYGSLPAGQPLTLRFSVTPLELAELRLAVQVSGEVEGLPQSRNLSIPIRPSGAARKRAPARLKIDGSGQIIHSLPAQAGSQRR